MLLRAKNYHLHAFNMFVVEKACINSISTLDRFLQYNLTVDYIESFQPVKINDGNQRLESLSERIMS